MLENIANFFGFSSVQASDYEEKLNNNYEKKFDSIESSLPIIPNNFNSEDFNSLETIKTPEFIFCRPTSFDEIGEIINLFSSDKSILVNLELVDSYTAQRLIDYICGCLLTLDGQQIRISQSVFLFVNRNVEVAEDLIMDQVVEKEARNYLKVA